MYKILLWLPVLFMQASQAVGAPPSGACGKGTVARCHVEYYNDGSRAEFYQNSESARRMEWRVGVFFPYFILNAVCLR